MRIGIYSESSRGTTSVGGSEYIVVVLAEALAQEHQVEIIHHFPSLTAEHFADRFGVDPKALALRYQPREQPPQSAIPWRRHLEERRWHTSLSEPYELFIDVAHDMPPFCRASHGFLLVLFPFSGPGRGAGEMGRSGIESKLWMAARGRYLHWMWRKRLESYGVIAAISEFSRFWTLRRWGVDSHVLHPPCDGLTPAPVKQKLILSAGRFTAKGVMKKQPEMIEAFKRLSADVQGWEYASVGALLPAPDEEAFFQELTRRAQGFPIRLVPNLDRSELREIFGRAKIFWHATGLDEDETSRPEMAEHFGIVTVEAMSAGCVPVVIRKGAQPEIVEDGVSGFLWDTLEELQSYSRRLMDDERLFAVMSQNARIRAGAFSRERFLERFQELAEPLLG